MHVGYTILSLVIIIIIQSFGLFTHYKDCPILQFQADVETDEVYAQMTLQPLTPVIFVLKLKTSFSVKRF